MGRGQKKVSKNNLKSWKPGKNEQFIWKSIERVSIVLGIVVSILTVFNTVTGAGTANSSDNTVQQTKGDGYVIQAKDGSVVIANVEGTSQHIETDPGTDSDGQALLVMLKDQTLSGQLAGSADLIRKQFYSEAVQLLTEMLDQEILSSKMLAAIYYNRGVAYCHLENFGLAQEDFSKALSHMEFSNAYYSLGAVSAALARQYEKSENAVGDPIQEYKRAIENYTQALKYEENAIYFLARAASYEAIDDTNDAINDYQMVLLLDEGNETARTALKRLTCLQNS